MNAIFPTRSKIGGAAERQHPAAANAISPAAFSAPIIINRDTGFREAASYRRTVHASDSFHVENSSVSASAPAPSGFETGYQVVLPYLGLFQYHVGQRSSEVDSASTLFVQPDREFRDVHPLAGVGHAGIIINLAADLVDEIGFHAGSRSAFSDMVRPASLRLRLITHQMLRCFERLDDPLFADEWTMAALFEAFSTRPKGIPRSSGFVQKAKLLLHAREGERLTLEEIASEIGVSKIYLTQEFTRVEGVPLYRYQLHLRMNRALLELPHCNDITRLALDLGFSSHSHFTAAFGRHFGMTPSAYRMGQSLDRSWANGHLANLRRWPTGRAS